MRREDVAADRQQYLVPALGYPHVCALVAPPTPRSLTLDPGQGVRLAEAHTALGRLQGSLERIPNADLVTRTLARREAVRSSQIEGTHSDLTQLLTYEATHTAGDLPPDVRITQRYVEALQLGLERVRAGGRGALTLTLINELHACLMRDTPEHTGGQPRLIQNWIGPARRIEDATFVPAPPAYVPDCLAEMRDSILQYAPREDEQASLSLLAQLAIAHAQFETIHPYLDGNGRVGRLLMPLILAAEGLPPLYISGSLLRAKLEYYAALAQVQLQGRWGAWIELLARAVIESCDDSIAIARDLLALAERWESELRGSYRAGSATRALPRLLISQPVLSVAQAAAALGVSVPAANGALNNLLKAGIVGLVNERQWGRIFHAREVIERLDRAPG
jgi:Fic family protein